MHKGSLRRWLAVGLLLGACEGGPGSEPAGATDVSRSGADGAGAVCVIPTAEDADDVREAALRRLMADDQMSRIVVFFVGISHGDGIDLAAQGAAPAPAFLARFADAPVPVATEPAARYEEETGAVVSMEGASPGAVLHVGTVHWTDADTARVDASWYLANLSAQGFTLTLQRGEDGGWVVVEQRGSWIS